MGNCSTCKHWVKSILDKDTTPENARCNKLFMAAPEDGVMVDMSGIYDEIGWEGEEDYYTGCNFGCIHHESK